MLQVWLTWSSRVRRTFLTDACFSLIICQLKLEQFQPPRCRSTTPNSLPPPLPPLYFLFTTSLKPQRWNSQSQQGDGPQFPLKHPRLARAHLNQSSRNIIMSSTTRYVFSPWKNALCEIFYLISVVFTFFFEQRNQFHATAESSKTSLIVVGVLTALAFLTRFYKINNPDEVVYVSLVSPFSILLCT